MFIAKNAGPGKQIISSHPPAGRRSATLYSAADTNNVAVCISLIGRSVIVPGGCSLGREGEGAVKSEGRGRKEDGVFFNSTYGVFYINVLVTSKELLRNRFWPQQRLKVTAGKNLASDCMCGTHYVSLNILHMTLPGLTSR